MRVKIGDTWYEGVDQPLAVQFDNSELELLRKMLDTPESNHCFAVGEGEPGEILEWMKEGRPVRRVVSYQYTSWVENCGCCSDSASEYSVWEDGVLVTEDQSVKLCENEAELRLALAELEPFEIDDNTNYF